MSMYFYIENSKPDSISLCFTEWVIDDLLSVLENNEAVKKGFQVSFQIKLAMTEILLKVM